MTRCCNREPQFRPLGFYFSKEGECVILILSRKTGERVLVGDNIVITLVRIGPNSVRFGIEAPKDMVIVREELASHPIQPENVDEIGLRSEGL